MHTKPMEAIQVKSSGEHKTLSIPADLPLQFVYKADQSHELFHQSLNRLSWQRRDETTVLYSILSPDIAPQWISALLALGAEVFFAEREHSTPLEDFLPRVGPHSGELTALRIPQDIPGRVWAEEYVSTAPSAAPIVSAFAVVDLLEDTVQRARLALTGVWRENARLAAAIQTLVGGPLNSESIQRAAKAVEAEVAPQSDFLGSSDYRRAMSAVLTRRVLDQCQNYAEKGDIT
jgi:CO/xanthine dehydrogenase FAD-binding subunit